MTYSTSVPATTASGQGSSPPVCQNCSTSTTPLWRRDELGSVLCNACGLFLKLHGRPRPISLKTDVIKSRNRVKAGQGPKKRRTSFEANGGLPATAAPPATPLSFHSHLQQTSHVPPVPTDRERSTTPHHSNPNIAPQHLFDQVTTFDTVTQPSSHSPSLPHFALRHPSPAPSHLSASSSQLNGTAGHLEPPQTQDAVAALNTSLKTRVSELEVINDLFRGRVAELEKSERDARQAEKASIDEADRLRQELNRARHREQILEQRLEELAQNGIDYDVLNATEEEAKRGKRRRIDENGRDS